LLPIALPQGIKGGAPVHHLLLIMLLEGLHSSLECLGLGEGGGVLQEGLLTVINGAEEVPALPVKALAPFRTKQARVGLHTGLQVIPELDRVEACRWVEAQVLYELTRPVFILWHSQQVCGQGPCPGPQKGLVGRRQVE
jgi:hypothetical protein